jgi:hypothetical protein
MLLLIINCIIIIIIIPSCIKQNNAKKLKWQYALTVLLAVIEKKSKPTISKQPQLPVPLDCCYYCFGSQTCSNPCIRTCFLYLLHFCHCHQSLSDASHPLPSPTADSLMPTLTMSTIYGCHLISFLTVDRVDLTAVRRSISGGTHLRRLSYVLILFYHRWSREAHPFYGRRDQNIRRSKTQTRYSSFSNSNCPRTF